MTLTCMTLAGVHFKSRIFNVSLIVLLWDWGAHESTPALFISVYSWSGRKPSDPSNNRYIMSMSCSKPFVKRGVEFVVITVKGKHALWVSVQGPVNPDPCNGSVPSKYTLELKCLPFWGMEGYMNSLL